jgi:endonuclease YncB( thermonuclease family)
VHPRPSVPPPSSLLPRVRGRIARLPRKVLIPVAATGLVGLAGIGSLANAEEAPAPDAEARVQARVTAAPTTAPRTEMPTTVAPVPTTAVAPPPTTAVPAPPTTLVAAPPPPIVPTSTVSAVIDGDTVDLSDGERVRLIGIDTPEQGQPGYAAAAAAMSAMVLGHQVVLSPGAHQDRDRYGRLLRYVDVDGQDVGLAMIAQGWAVARYDSRDGYGHHPREETYLAADQASAPAFAAAPLPPAPAAGGPTDQRFPTCKAAKAAGVGPYVSGQDPEYDWYRDADHDGVVCE